MPLAAVVSRVALRLVVFVSRVEMDLDRSHVRIVMRDLAPHRSAIACALRSGISSARPAPCIAWSHSAAREITLAGIGTITMASLQRSMPLRWRIEMARTVV
jgi:hypothetical protein